MKHGTKYESTALALLAGILNQELFKVGLLMHKDHYWLCGTPDGVTTDANVEVKCISTTLNKWSHFTLYRLEWKLKESSIY
jgi:hypothetical protein